MAAQAAKVCGVALGAFISLKSLQTLSQRRRGFLLAKEEQEDLQLVHVQIAFRHGARTPIFPLPDMKGIKLDDVVWDKNVLLGDLPHTVVKYRVKNMDGGKRPVSEYDEKQQTIVWPGDTVAGVLTKVGQQQMYELGKRIHHRYMTVMHFLQPMLSPHEVYVRTSNIQRTVDSARCVLAGLYGQENINGTVTMVTLSEEEENIYPNLKSCPELKRWVKSALSAKMLQIHSNYLENRQHLMEELKIEDKRFAFVYLRDFLAAQEAHNLPISPVFLKYQDMIEEHALQELMSAQCGFPHGRHEVLRLGVGKTLETFVNRMKDKIDKKSPSQHKLCLYSVHDTTLVCLMVSLGIDVKKWPDFAADLTFELYKNKNEEYFVKVLLQGKEQVLPAVNKVIFPFEKFRKLSSPYSVEDWHEECSKSHQ